MIISEIIAIIVCSVVTIVQNNDLNSKGVDAINRGDYVTGITYLEQAYNQNKTITAIQSNLLNSYIKYASELIQKKQLDLSVSYADKAFRMSGLTDISRGNLSRIYYNIAALYYQQKNYNAAEVLLNKSEQLVHSQLPVLVLQGHIAYSKQNLSGAESYWKKALQLDPSNSEISKLLAVLSKQSTAETKLGSMQSGDIFDIHYDRGAIGNEIFEIKQHLMECYRESGQEFGYYPTHPVIVILYNESEFRSTLNVRSQVAGLYDGKIRLPLNFKKYSLSELKKTIRHEYTHAIVQDLAGSNCPVWLHEGLAVYAEKGSFDNDISLIKAALQNNLAYTFDMLSNSQVWNRSDLAPLAYSQSYGIVRYMVVRWNMHVVCEFLKKIKAGESFENVLSEITNTNMQELDRNWKASVESR
jgi:tetratricopeptide (TPR) repeat protein